MVDGTKLNVMTADRQMLRAFGGLNETYGCSEAEMSAGVNFSSRGFPALQTRKRRVKTREVKDVNGMYHLNGAVLCRGKTLEYVPDAQRAKSGAVVLENAVTDDRKMMVGMGSKVLIWPDRKAFDTETGELLDLGAVWELGDGEMELTLCDAEGKSYSPTAGTELPGEPADGQVFLKGDAARPYSSESVLMRYSAKNKKWDEVQLTAVRMRCPGISGGMREGDTVTVSGMPQAVTEKLAKGLCGEVNLAKLEGDSAVVSLSMEKSDRFFGSWTVRQDGVSWKSMDGKVTENAAAEGKVKIERRVPELDFAAEQGNRVWGCSRKENTIYACALGDPTNWYKYQGIASDSYAVSVGSDGEFTGAVSCMGYLLFFKENCIHKLYGSKPSDYQLSSVRCRGVAMNAGRSLCVIAETLYYLSPDGVMAWSGSLPTKVSGTLDAGKLTAVDWAMGGQLDGKYYLYLHRESGGRMLVYDTERGLWQEESGAGTEMMSTGQQLYLWDGSGLWAVDPDREGTAGSAEETLQFEAVTGDIGLSGPDDKYAARVTLRVDAKSHTVLRVAVSYDGGPWEELGSCAVAQGYQRVNLPFVLRRHDLMRLRFYGSGEMALRSAAFSLQGSGGARVSGAVPKR